MAFVRVTKKSEVQPGGIREFQVDGKSIALANVDGKFHAISSVCLHHGGPLGEGQLVGATVTCPWHGWEYDVTTGKLKANPAVGVDCYPIEIRGDDIFIDCG